MESEIIHRHGGTPEADLSRLDLQQGPILDFSVNLNPLGPPEIIRERWMDVIDGIENYPTLEGDGVSYYYQKKFGISPKNVLVGNGSTEMIYLLPRVLGFREVIVISPSYHDYSRASEMAGAKVIRYHLSAENKFRSPGRDKIIKLLKDAEALWLGNPNNPTGSLFRKELILELAEKFPEKWFIIDEAFMQYVEESEEISLVVHEKMPNILVTHSLTKFYCLAGLRLGGVIGHEKVISRLRKSKEPWTVNGVAEKIAPLLLQCEDYEGKSRSLIQGERRRLFNALESIRGITPYPSFANFILCRWQLTDNLDDLMRRLLSNGIYVRDCRNFNGLEKNFFRLAIRSPEENDRLINIISSYADDLNG